MSILADAGLTVKVGSDISSATNGSSVRIVAGKKRSPTKPWVWATEGNKDSAAKAANAAQLLDVIKEIPSRT